MAALRRGTRYFCNSKCKLYINFALSYNAYIRISSIQKQFFEYEKYDALIKRASTILIMIRYLISNNFLTGENISV